MLTLIGDVHGKRKEYRILLKQIVGPTLQVGDLDFNYEGLHVEGQNYFIGGNHDNYELIEDAVGYLGDYGENCIGGVPFYQVRGAFSIDKHFRRDRISWWREEELTFVQRMECYTDYEFFGCGGRIPLVVSHDCPQSVCETLWPYINDITVTRELLEVMFQEYAPQLWIFGHHHKSENVVIGKTRFICLAELETLTLEYKDGTFISNDWQDVRT